MYIQSNSPFKQVGKTKEGEIQQALVLKEIPGRSGVFRWVAEDVQDSPNIGIKNQQIKRSSKIQLKPKNILNPDPVQPKMVDPLYKMYSRKLNQQTGEYIYKTNKGEVRKQRGQEDGQFISQNRKAFNKMRKKK